MAGDEVQQYTSGPELPLCDEGITTGSSPPNIQQGDDVKDYIECHQENCAEPRGDEGNEKLPVECSEECPEGLLVLREVPPRFTGAPRV